MSRAFFAGRVCVPPALTSSSAPLTFKGEYPRPPDSDCCKEGVPAMSLQPRRSHLEVEDIGEITVCKVREREILDEHTIQVIGDQLSMLVDELGRRKVLVNFSNVEKMSSAALGKVTALNRKLKSVGGRLVLCGINPLIYEAF